MAGQSHEEEQCSQYVKRRHVIIFGLTVALISEKRELIQAGKQMITNGLNHSQVHLINELTMESADTDSSLRRNETYLKLLELVTLLIHENLTVIRMGVTSYEHLTVWLPEGIMKT